jgi:hypothetical protein
MEPPRGKSICVPFKSEDHYAICVADPDGFRQYLMDLHSRHPEMRKNWYPRSLTMGDTLLYLIQ